MKVLTAHEHKKKKKYLKPYLEQHWHFTPCVVSTNGMIGKESKLLLESGRNRTLKYAASNLLR
jgi:hypothetical protein